MTSKGPWDIPKRDIKQPGFIWHVKLHKKYCWRSDKSQVILYGWFTNIDILKLCGIHMFLICPGKMWSVISLVIISKCCISQQWPCYFVNCNLIRFFFSKPLIKLYFDDHYRWVHGSHCTFIYIWTFICLHMSEHKKKWKIFEFLYKNIGHCGSYHYDLYIIHICYKQNYLMLP